MSKSLPDLPKRLYRSHRYGGFRLGHPLLRRLLGLFVPVRVVTRHRSGLRLELDRRFGNQDTLFWTDGDIEPQLYWAIRTLVPIGGVFVDCGANVGLMGLLARQYRMARVIFLEPHPRLAASVRRNLELNGFTADCTLLQAAASDAPGEASFYENPRLDGSHSLHADWEGGDGTLLGSVKTTTLAAVVADLRLPGIDFLKVDTEGHDLAVLHGLKDRLRPDFTRVVYAEMGRDATAIAGLMTQTGYVGFSLRPMVHRAVVRTLLDFERGGPADFFEPHDPARSRGDVLWCGRDSLEARFLSSPRPHD